MLKKTHTGLWLTNNNTDCCFLADIWPAGNVTAAERTTAKQIVPWFSKLLQ